MHGEVSTVSEICIKILDKLGIELMNSKSLMTVILPLPLTEKDTYRTKAV